MSTIPSVSVNMRVCGFKLTIVGSIKCDDALVRGGVVSIGVGPTLLGVDWPPEVCVLVPSN